MEGGRLQSFFKSQGGHTGTNAPSTLLPPPSPRPLPSVISSPRPSTYTESRHDTSLVQKLAARFVPASASQCLQDATDEGATPLSRGGNPVHQHQLFASTMGRLEREPVFIETRNEKESKLMKEPAKGSNTTLSVMILLWLINQREILRDLTELKNCSTKEQNSLLKNQESIQNQMTTLDQQVMTLQILVQSHQQQVKSDMAYTKKLITLFGLIHLVVMVTTLCWSNKTVRGMLSTWWNNLRKSVVQPSVSVLKYCKNVSRTVVNECSVTLHHYKDVLSSWR